MHWPWLQRQPACPVLSTATPKTCIIHIAINKVHPSKHTIHNPFQDYKTLAKLCAQLEQQYGLEVDNHSTQRNHSAGRARDMEAHAGIESPDNLDTTPCPRTDQAGQ